MISKNNYKAAVRLIYTLFLKQLKDENMYNDIISITTYEQVLGKMRNENSELEKLFKLNEQFKNDIVSEILKIIDEKYNGYFQFYRHVTVLQENGTGILWMREVKNGIAECSLPSQSTPIENIAAIDLISLLSDVRESKIEY